MMTNIVLVRKQDRRADLQRRHVGNELLVSLVDHVFCSGVSRSCARFRKDHRVGNGRAFSIFYHHVQRTGLQSAKRHAGRQKNDVWRVHASVGKSDFRFDQMIDVFKRPVGGVTKLVVHLQRNVFAYRVAH